MGATVQGPGRLMSWIAPPGTWVGLEEHRDRFAPPPPVRRAPNLSIVDAVERAGLRGRGGAGFPTAVKLRAVMAGRTRPVVVANGSEGEPTSKKDGLVMSGAPHLVIDGALVAAAAVGANEILFAVNVADDNSRGAIARALAERHRESGTPPMKVVDVPDRYIAGEERALVNLVNRGSAIPPAGDSRPFEKGVAGRPTLVQNVETLAHLALINHRGSDWFRSIGTEDVPGTTLVTVGGAVANAGVYEVAVGTPFVDLLGAAGGATENIGAVLVGGYAGTWLSLDEAIRVRLEQESLASVEGILGCGSIVVLPASSCGLHETAAVLRWMADQSAGQCGPCVFGLESIAGAAGELRDGRKDARLLSRLTRWAGDVEGRGACRFPDGAVRLMRSALKTFGTDANSHVQGRRCAGVGRRYVLPLPGLRRAS